MVEQTVAGSIRGGPCPGEKDPAAMSDQELIKAWDMDGADMMWWFRFLYDRRTTSICCSLLLPGNPVRQLPPRLGGASDESHQRLFSGGPAAGLCRNDVEPAELHILLSAFWTTIYEPFIHHFTWEQIEPTAGSSAACSTGMERCSFRNRGKPLRRRGFSPAIS